MPYLLYPFSQPANDRTSNVEQRVAEISLLQAMYPEEFSWAFNSPDEVFYYFKKAN